MSLNYLTTRRLHRDISTILTSKYGLLRWWSYLSKLLMELLQSIKWEKILAVIVKFQTRSTVPVKQVFLG